MAPPAVPPPVVAPQPNEVFPPEAPPQHAVMPFGLQSQMQQMLDMMAGFSQVTHGKGGGGSASSVHESSVHESDSDGGESDDDLEIVKRPFFRALSQGPYSGPSVKIVATASPALHFFSSCKKQCLLIIPRKFTDPRAWDHAS